VAEHADRGAGAGSTVAQDALRRLEERLELASGAAERLFSEAAAQATSAALNATRAGAAPRAETTAHAPETEPTAGAARGDRDARRRADPPPQGWASDEQAGPLPPGDLELLITALEAIGELVPPDLRRRLGDAVREVLLAVRALIDWYLERDEGRSSEPPEVQDIPVL
jgi:hypothetical protein